MKKVLASFMLLAVLFGAVSPSFAEEAAPAAEAVMATTEAPAAEAAPAPVPDKGDTTWMMLSTLLVILMIVPGLSLFYGGLVPAKNMLSVLSQVFGIFALISILWVIYGYSLAFGDGGSMNWMIGDTSKFFLAGMTGDSTAATFSDGVVIPEFTFVAFQLTFAAITTALIIGGFAERIKFGSLMVFSALWFTFAYLPIAHMVWATGGYLFEKGALDFAGGTVVHINAG
ncbi:MAG: ammonia channel protein, partial [Gammaproteobacteria bacterium]|nr:ammonia channel protein [Gammaproteobacteria bacterium]